MTKHAKQPMVTGQVISLESYRALTRRAGSAATGSRNRAETEEDLQRRCFNLAQEMEVIYPLLRFMFHSPNGGGRSKAEGGALKAQGVRRGVPDFLLPLHHGAYCGLALELKIGENSLSVEQREWLQTFRAEGYLVGVVRSISDFSHCLRVFFGEEGAPQRALPGLDEILDTPGWRAALRERRDS